LSLLILAHAGAISIEGPSASNEHQTIQKPHRSSLTLSKQIALQNKMSRFLPYAFPSSHEHIFRHTVLPYLEHRALRNDYEAKNHSYPSIVKHHLHLPSPKSTSLSYLCSVVIFTRFMVLSSAMNMEVACSLPITAILLVHKEAKVIQRTSPD
jgi:hypothetical protein